MPFNGSGVFSPAVAGYPAVGGTTILASFYNAMVIDIATNGLTNCLTKDGQGKPSSSIDWNNQNLTNVNNFGLNGTITQSGTLAMSFLTSSLTRMTITAAGDIGIGTTVPNYVGFGRALTVESTSTTLQAGLELAGNAADSDAVGVGSLAYRYQTNIAAHRTVALISANTDGVTANQRGGALVFYTKANAVTSLAARLLITGIGDIGIGTATPNIIGAGRAITIQSTATNTCLELIGSFPDAALTSIAFIDFRQAANIVSHQRVVTVAAGTIGTTANQRGAVLQVALKPDGVSGQTIVMTMNPNRDIEAKGVAIIRAKTATTSRNTTTTLADDPDMTLALLANTNYIITFHILMNADVTNVMGYKHRINYTGTLATGSTEGAVAGGGIFVTSNTFDINSTITNANAPTGGNALAITYMVAIRTVNAGTISFQWAQNSSNANNLNIMAGSALHSVMAS